MTISEVAGTENPDLVDHDVGLAVDHIAMPDHDRGVRVHFRCVDMHEMATVGTTLMDDGETEFWQEPKSRSMGSSSR